MGQHLNKYAEHSRVHNQPDFLYQSQVSCLRKRRHATIVSARKEQARLAAAYPMSIYETYYCSLCNGYHVGKVPHSS